MNVKCWWAACHIFMSVKAFQLLRNNSKWITIYQDVIGKCKSLLKIYMKCMKSYLIVIFLLLWFILWSILWILFNVLRFFDMPGLGIMFRDKCSTWCRSTPTTWVLYFRSFADSVFFNHLIISTFNL
jgi:hypothetical protein